MRSLTIIQHTRCRNRICRRSSVTIYRTKIAKKKKYAERLTSAHVSTLQLAAQNGGIAWSLLWIAIHAWRHLHGNLLGNSVGCTWRALPRLSVFAISIENWERTGFVTRSRRASNLEFAFMIETIYSLLNILLLYILLRDVMRIDSRLLYSASHRFTEILEYSYKY